MEIYFTQHFFPAVAKQLMAHDIVGVVSDIPMQPGCSFIYSRWLNSSTTAHL
jgi:hypothetical protein